MNQEIFLIGLNHRTAQVDIRERFALTGCNPYEQNFISTRSPVQELLVLSTCNRVELLAIGDKQEAQSTIEHLLSSWATTCCQQPECLPEHIYTYQGEEAIRHLFTVASSLDSMILGEPQILGQLKSAYRDAVQNKATGAILNRLIHKAFSVAKRVRTETDIASSAVSISYAAVELAKKIFGELGQQKAMLIGAGEMAELAATHLLGAGVQDIYVANRTLANGQELAQKFKGQAIEFENLLEELPQVDIIISSTGSHSAIIKAKDIKKVLKRRKHKPMFFIDIAVPRDIDPDVNSLDNIYLYDIDDLKDVVEENIQARQSEAQRAINIVEEEVQKFIQWLHTLDIKPTIVDLMNRAEQLAYKEVSRSLKNLNSNVNQQQIQEVMETLALSVAKKICLEPVEFLKRKNKEPGSSREVASLMRRIFNLDEEDIPQKIHQHKK